MTCQSWPLRALLAKNVWKNRHKNWLFVSGQFWKSYSFGSRSLLEPNFWHNGPILWVLQTLFGIFWDFHFLASYSPILVQKIQKIAKKCYFWLFGPEKWLKISKSKKFSNNVWKTHKMQQLGPIWGPEIDLGPKIRDLPKSRKENLKMPKMYRISRFFEISTRDISATERAFSIP